MTTDPVQAQLAAQAADIAHLQRTINQLTATHPEPSEHQDEQMDEEEQGEPTLLFDSLDEFVTQFAETHYERPSHTEGDIKWFGCWPAHPSALWVMEILWGSFEEARVADIDGGGGSNCAAWMVATFIPLMEWITAHDGPMGLCSTRSCEGPAQLGRTTNYMTMATA